MGTEHGFSPESVSSNWYVAHCAPHKEPVVQALLQRDLGLQAYLPMVNRRFRGQLRPTPFFPGYVFVRTELQSATGPAINATPGVLRLLAFDGSPQPVPGAVIEAIRERIDQMNEHGGLPGFQFSNGDPVRINAGPLEGMEAVFLRPMRENERVRIMIQFLGHLRETEVPVSVLEKRPSLPRRSRGRGRPIRARSA